MLRYDMATKIIKESVFRKMLKGKHVSRSAVEYIDDYVYSIVDGLVAYLLEEDGRIQEMDVSRYLRAGNIYGIQKQEKHQNRPK